MKRRTRRSGSRNTVATRALSMKLRRSPKAQFSASIFSSSWLLTLVSSSFTDWSSSFEVCSSSLEACNSSLSDISSSWATRSSALLCSLARSDVASSPRRRCTSVSCEVSVIVPPAGGSGGVAVSSNSTRSCPLLWKSLSGSTRTRTGAACPSRVRVALVSTPLPEAIASFSAARTRGRRPSRSSEGRSHAAAPDGCRNRAVSPRK